MLNLYTTYPNSIIYSDNLPNFINLKTHIKFIYNLGFNAIHVLPFFKSPQIDRGFDVENYMEIDEKHGTIEEFKDFLSEAKKYNIKIFVDLILNHTSINNTWFKKATENNDEKYKDYFIHTNIKPEYIKEKSSENIAVFKINNSVICMEQPSIHNSDFPFWIEKNSTWYYHSFYPQQVDLNWGNKNILREFKSIIKYWSSFGLNFRLDAATLIGSDPYKNPENFNKLNCSVLKTLKKYCLEINPECLWIGEATQNYDLLSNYFYHNIFDYCYNFKLNTELWNTIKFEDSSYILDELKCQKQYPQIKWINYVRNHDELILSKKEEIIPLFNCPSLINPNLEFNIGPSGGISGTTLSLCCENLDQFKLVYFLTMIISENFSIISGDEIAKSNGVSTGKDTREISRHPIRNVQSTFSDVKPVHLKKNEIPDFITELNKIRSSNVLKSYKTKEKCSKHVLFFKNKEYLSIINISTEKPFKIKKKEKYSKEYILGNVSINQDVIILGTLSVVVLNLTNEKKISDIL